MFWQRYGTQAAFIAAGGYHHHIGLNTWESQGGSPPPAGTTGLYHIAILYPTRAAFADALRRLIAAGISLDGVSDPSVSEALYLRDPDQNGVELYWDRPEDAWPRTPQGELAMESPKPRKTHLLKGGESPLSLERSVRPSQERRPHQGRAARRYFRMSQQLLWGS